VSPQLPTFLDNENLQFILFGGKGGVGKTTSSAATAVHLANARPDKKILIFSTDPAHSLSDSFDCRIGDTITKIEGFDNLSALEMDAEKLHKSFMDDHQYDLVQLANRATYFNTKQLKGTFAMSYPSSFEFMALMKMIELVESGEYDFVIFDTAPTGHTIQLFNLLTGIEDQLDAMKRSQEKRKYMMTKFAGKFLKDKADKFIDDTKADIRKLKRVLKSDRTEFVTVTIPEAMGVYETERLVTILDKNNVVINNVIVNGVNTSTECNFCASRKENQEKYIEEINRKFPKCNIVKVPMFPYEIRGVKSLIEFGNVLSGGDYTPKSRSPPSPESGSDFQDSLLNVLSLKKDLKFVLFGGKGGVGKTTSSTATAVHLAKNRPDKKILIFSTDPAHSLSDSFDCEIGGTITKIEGFDNLYGLEIVPEDVFSAFKTEYEKEVESGFNQDMKSSGGGLFGAQSILKYTFDEETIGDLTSVAPLGLDELMVLSKTIMNSVDEYDLIIIDTAPTGHLIRLLSRPNIVVDWFSTIVKGLMNYEGMMSVHGAFEILLKTKKEIMDTQRILMDHERTEFVAVTIPEAMGMYETKDLLTDIGNLKISSKHIIVNRVIPPTECSFCLPKRQEQLGYVRKINKLFPECAITEMPLFPHEIRGIKDLSEFAGVMYQEDIAHVEHREGIATLDERKVPMKVNIDIR